MMEKRMTGFCMLVEVNTEENKAVYEDLKRSILIELEHEKEFIEYLARQVEDEQLCYWIDLEKKEIINKEL